MLAVIIAVLGWLPTAIQAHAAGPSSLVVAYGYDTRHHFDAPDNTTTERGPPAWNYTDTTYDAVDWSDGALARPNGPTPPVGAAGTYDHHTRNVHLAQVRGTTREHVQGDGGALTSPARERVAAKTADEVAEGVSRSPSFIVKPNGEMVIVPKGAQGPFPVESGKGFMFRGGSGGHGLSDAATDVRIMDPVTGGKYPKPNGYASYLNGGGQTINPFTGQTVGKSSPWWHWEFLP